jgi:hypothetical protein
MTRLWYSPYQKCLQRYGMFPGHSEQKRVKWTQNGGVMAVRLCHLQKYIIDFDTVSYHWSTTKP